ncbi:hypothetical protein DMENIID0001_123790 [Sergentomyia squamirostris]
MDRLSPDRALLMEIALGLLGNTVYNVYGKKQESLIDLFRENAIPDCDSEESGISQQESQMIPLAQRIGSMDPALPLALCYGEPYMANEYENFDPDLFSDPNDEFRDQEFVKLMMTKIETEYSNIMKQSLQQKQNHFMEFWMHAANDFTSAPDVADIDVKYIAKDFFSREKNSLEEQIKIQRESMIYMKKSGRTNEEVAKIQRIARQIELVKKAMEEDMEFKVTAEPT